MYYTSELLVDALSKMLFWRRKIRLTWVTVYSCGLLKKVHPHTSMDTSFVMNINCVRQ